MNSANPFKEEVGGWEKGWLDGKGGERVETGEKERVGGTRERGGRGGERGGGGGGQRGRERKEKEEKKVCEKSNEKTSE